jgi:hypothetical protein
MLSTNLIPVAALAVLAGCVSARVMKAGTPFSVQTLEKDEAGEYLDVPRGVMVGSAWAAVAWAVFFVVVALLLDAGA